MDGRSTAEALTGNREPEAARPMRIVFDTNVLVSLFVFADSRFQRLRTRIEAGDWIAMTDERCLAEFRRVLGYPIFGLDRVAQEAALAAYTRLTHPVAAVANPAAALPQCKDPDDQKFLELARNGKADWLVTSDKALLKLARRDRLRDQFRILTPEVALASELDGARFSARP